MRIRDLQEADLPFLQEMLYAALMWRPDGERPPLEKILAHPQVVIFHEGWGRNGDTCILAEEEGKLIGAVWYRLFTEEVHGEGYVDADTPELAIAVVEGHRNEGVGRALMEAAHLRAKTDGFKSLSLSADLDNPARRLYSALGYKELDGTDGDDRMLLNL